MASKLLWMTTKLTRHIDLKVGNIPACRCVSEI